MSEFYVAFLENAKILPGARPKIRKAEFTLANNNMPLTEVPRLFISIGTISDLIMEACTGRIDGSGVSTQ